MRLIHHEDQYNYNERLLNSMWFEKSTFFDWMITVSFYTTLHKIDKCLHILGFNDRQISNHSKRLSKVINNLPIKISSEYVKLYSKCREVRYRQFHLNNISTKELNKCLNIWFNIIKPYIP